MQTHLAPEYKDTEDGKAAEAILRKCVHCGFCTATCPTYQLLGDELDGPRGRIYLMKQVLEGETPTRKTQIHLDRCLTCRNCETTCPSGVQYGHLVDIGRKLVDAKVERPMGERMLRWALKDGLPSPLFAPAMKLGQAVRGVLPASLKAKVPAPQVAHRNGVTWPTQTHARKVLMLAGCVQPSMLPNVNTATARVLDAAGIQTLVASNAGCCGAVKFHLNDQEGGAVQMRANIDAWWPYVEQGVEAIIMNASGCGVMVKDYGHVLANDAQYAGKAEKISALTKDLSELLPELVTALKPKINIKALEQMGKQAFHPPCTLQHGQQLQGGVEKHLGDLGFDVQVANNEAHLCCGSAGTYSILQANLSNQLRDQKVSQLVQAGSTYQATEIVSGNVGCISHLQNDSLPVRHWIEIIDDLLLA